MSEDRDLCMVVVMNDSARFQLLGKQLSVSRSCYWKLEEFNGQASLVFSRRKLNERFWKHFRLGKRWGTQA